MMLIKASIENFKSFDKMAELTMISSNKIRTNNYHKVKIKSTQILKRSVVYGANAAGKSNLVEFFLFFKKCMSGSIPLDSSQIFCKTKEENRESTFELQFTVGSRFCAHGFSAVLRR